MSQFYHNGEAVILQYIDTSFLHYLHKNGITPRELPENDLSYRVFKYDDIDGNTKYACVMNTNVPDNPGQTVYITGKYPDDGFKCLMRDIAGQAVGDDAFVMQSRLKVAIETATGDAYEKIKERYPKNFKDFFHPIITDDMKREMAEEIKLSLTIFGYDEKILDMIDAPEFEKGLARKIFDGRGLEFVKESILFGNV